MRTITFLSLESWIEGVTSYILNCANSSIKQFNSFHIILSGGETPKWIYPELAKIDTNWEKWHFWIGDERAPDETFSQLNKNTIQDLFLDKIPYLIYQVHFMKVELGLDMALSDYSQKLKTVDMFDFALLGIGEDGHTASLFPGNDIGISANANDVLSVTNASKAPSNRLSLSANRLSATRNILFIVKGVNKRKTIEKIGYDDSLPCNKIIGKNESYLYYCGDIE